jgi:putative Holliday junction resolvase
VLGFDHGRLRIGVAVGQTVTATARPLLTLSNRPEGPPWDQIAKLVREWQPDVLLVGVPRHADGTASHTTRAALGFLEGLRSRFGLPVRAVDERLSSREAESRLRERHGVGKRRRQPLDQYAAALIVESWLNSKGPDK